MTTASRQLPGTAAQLPAATRFLQEFWEAAALPPAAAFPFELALEEIFMNVAMHGTHGDQVPTVWLEASHEDDWIRLRLEDDAPPFDPLQRATPDTAAALEDRAIGGLGIHLVREMMDQVEYSWSDGRNRLVMTKKNQPIPAAEG